MGLAGDKSAGVRSQVQYGTGDVAGLEITRYHLTGSDDFFGLFQSWLFISTSMIYLISIIINISSFVAASFQSGLDDKFRTLFWNAQIFWWLKYMLNI